MRTHRLATLAAASTVALLALGGTAFASTATATPTSTSAAAIAADRVGSGQVTTVERELEHGRVEWKVDVVRGAAPAPAVRSDDGPLHDVGDDHGGVSGKGSDDGVAHDGGDDHDRHGGGHDD